MRIDQMSFGLRGVVLADEFPLAPDFVFVD